MIVWEPLMPVVLYGVGNSHYPYPLSLDSAFPPTFRHLVNQCPLMSRSWVAHISLTNQLFVSECRDPSSTTLTCLTCLLGCPRANVFTNYDDKTPSCNDLLWSVSGLRPEINCQVRILVTAAKNVLVRPDTGLKG